MYKHLHFTLLFLCSYFFPDWVTLQLNDLKQAVHAQEPPIIAEIKQIKSQGYSSTLPLVKALKLFRDELNKINLTN